MPENAYLAIAGENDMVGAEVDLSVGELEVGAREDEMGARGRRGQPPQRQRYTGKCSAPIDSVSLLGPGETRTIEAKPQRAMVPQKFVTDSPGFLINSINVGVDPVFVSAGSVTSSVFGPQAADSPPFEARLCAANQSILVGITNDTGTARRFTGIFYGERRD